VCKYPRYLTYKPTFFMKIFCVGRNYSEHATELGNDVPDEPVIFMKPKSALLQPHTPFYYPEFTNELHYECELVLRISKNGKYIQDKFAGKYYDAITAGIDFTARDIQNDLKAKGLPWEKAKAWDNSAVIGKWVPLANIKDRSNVNFSFKKNGELVQQGNSKDMIFDFDYIVSYISNFFSINIGDLVFTGTPKGVGEIVVGDEVEAFIESDSMLTLDVK
jgi:2-keto-4-pentenoate hydratase/2-oxohepta-3-ene-1,7-dioic acid hydratase in catechol pathway